MSFLGHAPAAAEADLVARNTPAPDLTDGPVPGALRFPAINVGPWGRDYHQRLERVHAPYTFRDLPRILDAIRRHVLGPGKAT
ncbi:MAG: hypothetical protein Q8807_03985 ['Waltheria sp.' little leaf phytoplasma]|nr:hypothetical protein ['Waltheria sp.' little leaf phytoplasma]